MSVAYCTNRSCQRFYSGTIIGGVKGVVECHTNCGHVHIDEDGKCSSIIPVDQGFMNNLGGDAIVKGYGD